MGCTGEEQVTKALAARTAGWKHCVLSVQGALGDKGMRSVLNCPVDLSQWPLMFILMTLYHLRVSDPILWIRQLRLRETGSDPAGPQCRQWQDSEFPTPPQPLRVSVLE